jgi:hypothetical protein
MQASIESFNIAPAFPVGAILFMSGKRQQEQIC